MWKIDKKDEKKFVDMLNKKNVNKTKVETSKILNEKDLRNILNNSNSAKEIERLKMENFNLEKEWHNAISTLNFVEEEKVILECRVDKLEKELEQYEKIKEMLGDLGGKVDKICYYATVWKKALELSVRNRSLFSHGCPFKKAKANGCESFGKTARNCKECYEKFLLSEAINQVNLEKRLK